MRIRQKMAAGAGDLAAGEFPPAIALRGRIGRSAGLGNVALGVSDYGETRGLGGIYQKRVTGYNNKGRIPGRPRRTYYVRMRSYSSPNPNTPKQQAIRGALAAAVQAWRELTELQQKQYNERGIRCNRQGRHIFYSEYIKNVYRGTNN